MAERDERQPQLPTPIGRWLSGNPFQDEGVTFRWLVSVLVAAASVVLVGKLTSATLAMVWATILILAFGAAVARVVVYLLSSPDDD